MNQLLPPFYVNYDAISCWQCSLRSILEYWNPNKVWSWEELEALTGKEPGGTWSFKTCSELPDMGYEVKVIPDIDPQRFVQEREDYVRAFYKDAADYAVSATNFPLEVNRAENLLQSIQKSDISYQCRNFTADDIRNFIKDDYKLIVWVNARALDREPGAVGHFIMIYALEGDDVIFHDSRKDQSKGPRYPSRRESIDHVVASAKDGENMEGLFAIRPKRDA